MAEDASEGIDGIMGPSIPERSHGAGEASPDAAWVDNPDGLQSSPDIGEARDVLRDDPRPLTRGQGPSGFAATEADRRWIDAVLDDLEGRSPATKEALAKALLEHSVTSVGHVSGLELSTRKSAKNEHSTCDKSADPSAPHVSGTTFTFAIDR
ncbi:hypothetical protein [Novosphingobium sp.]|uniref:hypothetical protein n=1 Tax=Novosphingobium sp. TaxID=1874826 RepID=UPI001EBF2F97|nr:hypothetical protein [Novosphingobium sp.]MBK9011102.1 hypothetical protein [Novosphingobium sp.]